VTEQDGHLVWSPINMISHWELDGQATFVALSATNGTTLTLAATHMVYISESAADPQRRVPARARDVKVRDFRSIVRFKLRSGLRPCVRRAMPV